MHRLLLLATGLAPLAPLPLAAQYTVQDASAPARLRVTSEVINPGLEPFTATTAGFLGHSFLRNGGSGFEPIHYRDRFFATTDAADSITVDPAVLTNFNSYAQGMLDGASVLVFRVVNGRMVLARRDTVAPGGHKASGWFSQHGSSRLITPTATSFTGGFETWGRREVPYWFRIVAVDQNGREGAPSPAIRIDRPALAQGVRPAEQEAATVAVPRPPRNAPELPGLPAPANFSARYDAAIDQVRFYWDAVPSAQVAGYRIQRTDYDPATHAGYRLDLAGRAATPQERIRTGDMIIVQKEMLETSRRRHLTHRIQDARRHDALLPNLLKCPSRREQRLHVETRQAHRRERRHGRRGLLPAR